MCVECAVVQILEHIHNGVVLIVPAGVLMVLFHRKILFIHDIFHHQEQNKFLITTNGVPFTIELFDYCWYTMLVRLNYFKKSIHTDH